MPRAKARQKTEYRAAQKELDACARAVQRNWWSARAGEKGFSDTNYIFLSFVTKYLPAGLVGLVIAVIFAATMSASSGEINSLATVSVVDMYKRHFKRGGTDHHYLWASRWLTLFWGVYAVVFAGWAKRLGSLIVAVNMVGSLFYGSLLGCFVLAFVFRRVGGTAVFCGMLAGEAAIFATLFHAIFVALVQRDRLRGGDCDRACGGGRDRRKAAGLGPLLRFRDLRPWIGDRHGPLGDGLPAGFFRDGVSNILVVAFDEEHFRRFVDDVQVGRGTDAPQLIRGDGRSGVP